MCLQWAKVLLKCRCWCKKLMVSVSPLRWPRCSLHEALWAELRRVQWEVEHGDPGQEEGAGDLEPWGWVPRLPRNIQGAQTQEGAEIQDGAGGMISHHEEILLSIEIKQKQKFSKLYVFIITVSLKPDIIFKKYIINLMTEYKKAHNELTRYFKFNNCTILQTLYWLKYIISLESLPSLRRLTPGFHHLKHKISFRYNHIWTVLHSYRPPHWLADRRTGNSMKAETRLKRKREWVSKIKH